MTEWMRRSDWTATDASGVTLDGGELVGVAAHWPGTTAAAIGVESESQTAARLRGYRSFHVEARGWRDIGYNLAIDHAGRVWPCRTGTLAGDLVGAHCASAANPRANRRYVGVVLLLGASESPSVAMVRAFRDWYRNRFLARWPGRTDVRGHGQVAGAQTSCPGSRARQAIPTMTALTEDDMFDPDRHIDQIAAATERLIMSRTVDGSDDATGELPTVHQAIGRIDKRTYQLRAAIDPAAIAAAVVAELPGGALDQATAEAAFRAVLGSLDEEE